MLYLYAMNSGDPDFLFSQRIGAASTVPEAVALAEDYWSRLPGGVLPGDLWIYDRGRWTSWKVSPGPPLALAPAPLAVAYPPSGPIYPA